MTSTRAQFAAALSLLCVLTTSVWAQDRAEHREGERGREPMGVMRGERLQLDQRYHHDHYYPPRGQAFAALPGGSISIGFRGGNWFFHGGVWFQPYGSRFVVALPPIGIVVPLLPPDCTTLWIGGAPYYYANGVYYAPAPGQGYAVVAPPPGAEVAQPVAVAPAAKALPEPIIYPRSGQSPVQTEADRQECNRWATTQPAALADASVFQRSVAACMDGRGYTVR